MDYRKFCWYNYLPNGEQNKMVSFSSFTSKTTNKNESIHSQQQNTSIDGKYILPENQDLCIVNIEESTISPASKSIMNKISVGNDGTNKVFNYSEPINNKINLSESFELIDEKIAKSESDTLLTVKPIYDHNYLLRPLPLRIRRYPICILPVSYGYRLSLLFF